MARSLTAEEKNKVKNLQVSNSIYRRDIKDLVAKMQQDQEKLDALKAQEPELLGEEHAKVCQQITQFEASVKTIVGNIAYKEGRIAAKETEIEDIRNKASREEEVPVEVYDPNSPEALAKLAERQAARQKPGDVRRAKRAAKVKQQSTEPLTDEM